LRKRYEGFLELARCKASGAKIVQRVENKVISEDLETLAKTVGLCRRRLAQQRLAGIGSSISWSTTWTPTLHVDVDCRGPRHLGQAHVSKGVTRE